MSAAVERPAHRQVKMTDGFWAGQLDKIHRVTVWDVLNKFENDHEEGIMKIMSGSLKERAAAMWDRPGMTD